MGWAGERSSPGERIRGYGDLLEWSLDAGVLSPGDADRLREEAAADAEFRRRALGRAWSLRQALHDVLRAIARREAAADVSVTRFNAALQELPPHFILAAGGDGVALALPARSHPDPLHPILRSAMQLLGSPDLVLLRECADEHCGRLFLDLTKNASRRWCDMGTCGNRAKARRHLARRRGGA